jgi:hypothetical protein
MREPETDAIPRPTNELLDEAIDHLTIARIKLSVASYQETKNNRVEQGGRLARLLEETRLTLRDLRELRGSK